VPGGHPVGAEGAARQRVAGGAGTLNPKPDLNLSRSPEPHERFRVQVGIRSVLRELPDSVSQDELETVVRDLCADDAIDGLLVQLPLPPHIDEEAIIDVSALSVVVRGGHMNS